MKYLIALSILVSLFACKTTAKKEETKSMETSYSVQMAETVLSYNNIWGIEGRKDPIWSYTVGLLASSFIDLAQVTGNQKYFLAVKEYADSLIDENGIIKRYKKEDYNIDNLNSGKILFDLYEKTGDKRYKIALDTLRVQLKEHPRTELGGFWHKKRYPHQMWLDGLYMGGPFYARYAKKFNEPESFDEVALWFMNMEKVARDPKTGLLYHGWDESKEQYWANKETGLSPNFWGRGMGWYAMALVDVLDYLPKEHAGFDNIVGIIQRMADAIVKVQDDKTGTWYQVLDQGDREGNYLEGSVSCMLSYFLLKAVNKGYIDKDKFTITALKAFDGTVNTLIKVEANGNLVITPVCAVAGLGGSSHRDGTFEYYINEKKQDNDLKAVGPFIMASIQYDILKN